MSHNAKAIRELLPPARVLDQYEHDYAEHRGQLVTRRCPRCGERSRPSVYIDATSGAWKCHARGCSGDLYALLAGYAGLDVRRQFPAVVALAAKIAGVGGEFTPSDRERLLAEHRRHAAERAARERARIEAAHEWMPATWAGLLRRDVRGESYLRDRRGLDPAPLHARDVLRFTARGEPAVPLHDLGNGAIVGVQYRRLVDDEPRQRVLGGSQVKGAALAGRMSDLGPECVVVIAEGLVDTLTAYLAWPDAAIFGAPGAGQLGTVAVALAPRIAELCGLLLVVFDDDRAGHDGAASALVAAERAGLAHGAADAPREPGTVRLVDLGVGIDTLRHHDLNDAWRRSAWRWRWAGGSR